MKIMNYLLALAMIFTVGSCSKDTAVQDSENEELAAVDFRGRLFREQKEPQEIIELELNKYYLIGQLSKLDFERKQLEEQIDGGRKDLIPKLELTMKSFIEFENQMIDLQNLICHILGTIADKLAEQASNGDTNAEKKLLKMDESLKECGIEVSYTYYEAAGINYASIGKTTTVGGCQIPGRDFYNACDLPLPGGEHTVLVDGRLEHLIIKTEKGRAIGEAELIGKSELLDGFYEYLIEIPSEVGSKLSVAVSKKNYKYSVPIEVSDGF